MDFNFLIRLQDKAALHIPFDIEGEFGVAV